MIHLHRPAPQWLLVRAPHPGGPTGRGESTLKTLFVLAQQICRRGKFRRRELPPEIPGRWGGGPGWGLRGLGLGPRPTVALSAADLVAELRGGTETAQGKVSLGLLNGQMDRTRGSGIGQAQPGFKSSPVTSWLCALGHVT